MLKMIFLQKKIFLVRLRKKIVALQITTNPVSKAKRSPSGIQSYLRGKALSTNLSLRSALATTFYLLRSTLSLSYILLENHISYYLRVQVLTRMGSPLSDLFTLALRTGLINSNCYNYCHHLIDDHQRQHWYHHHHHHHHHLNDNQNQTLLEAENCVGIDTQLQPIHSVHKTDN